MKIPRNLAYGDRLWYSKTEYATAGFNRYNDVSLYEEVIQRGEQWLWATLPETGQWLAYVPNGDEVDGDTPSIIRIERIASAKPKRAVALIPDCTVKPKKAKVDKDAAWLLRLSNAMNTQGAKSEARRLRAIVRRLNRGVL